MIKISLEFVLKGPINNIPALVQIMAWRCPDDKPLSEPVVQRFTDTSMCHSASMRVYFCLHLCMVLDSEWNQGITFDTLGRPAR